MSERFFDRPGEVPEFKPAFNLEAVSPQRRDEIDELLEPTPAVAWEPPSPEKSRQLELEPAPQGPAAELHLPPASAHFDRQPVPGAQAGPLGHTIPPRQDSAPRDRTEQPGHPTPDLPPETTQPPAHPLGQAAVGETVGLDPAPADRTGHLNRPFRQAALTGTSHLDHASQDQPVPAVQTAFADAMRRSPEPTPWDDVPQPGDHPDRTAVGDPVHPEQLPAPQDHAEQPGRPTQVAPERLDDHPTRPDPASDTERGNAGTPEQLPGTQASSASELGDFLEDDDIEQLTQATPDEPWQPSTSGEDGYERLARLIVDDVPPDSPAQDAADDTLVQQKREQGLSRIKALKEIPDVEIIGDPEKSIPGWLPQGHNDRGVKRTCGVTTVAQLAQQQGVETSESEVLDAAVENGQYEMDENDPQFWGGVKAEHQIELLESLGLKGTHLHDMTVEDIADLVEQGHGVAIEVNSRDFRDRYSPDRPSDMFVHDDSNLTHENTNHSVVVTGVVKINGEVNTIIVNDPTGKPGVMLPIDVLDGGWRNLGGHMLVVRRPEAMP